MHNHGIDSLLNESTLNYHRGQRIEWVDAKGTKRRGTYVMASSAEGYIVVNTGGRYGQPAVVSIESII